MLRFIALRGVRADEHVEHSQRYIQGSKPCSRTFTKIGKQKKQIMQNNVETQHKHMSSLVVCVMMPSL